MADLFVQNVRPWGKASVNVLVTDGRIAMVGRDVTATPDAVTEDGGGALMLPGFVEAHTHLDKTLLGMDWVENNVPSRIIDKIDNERRMKSVLGLDPALQSARQVVMSAARGTTAIRSHVDIDMEHGLRGFEGVTRTREKYRDLVDMQIVAFPQSGMMIRKGTKELMSEALRQGADVVGGLDPCSIDRDPKGQLDAVFELAVKHSKPIDIHLHEAGELGMFSFGMIIERTKAHGLGGKVVVSHAFCLGVNDYPRVQALLEEIAEAGIGLMSTGPAMVPVPPLMRALELGIAFCSGTDGMRDLWNPWGNADMLERVQFLSQRNDIGRDKEVERVVRVCTHGGADVMGLADYGIEAGCNADFVLVEGRNVTEAAATTPPRKLVVKRGKVVARDGKALVEAP